MVGESLENPFWLFSRPVAAPLISCGFYEWSCPTPGLAGSRSDFTGDQQPFKSLFLTGPRNQA